MNPINLEPKAGSYSRCSGLSGGILFCRLFPIIQCIAATLEYQQIKRNPLFRGYFPQLVIESVGKSDSTRNIGAAKFPPDNLKQHAPSHQ